MLGKSVKQRDGLKKRHTGKLKSGHHALFLACYGTFKKENQKGLIKRG